MIMLFVEKNATQTQKDLREPLLSVDARVNEAEEDREDIGGDTSSQAGDEGEELEDAAVLHTKGAKCCFYHERLTQITEEPAPAPVKPVEKKADKPSGAKQYLNMLWDRFPKFVLGKVKPNETSQSARRNKRAVRPDANSTRFNF